MNGCAFEEAVTLCKQNPGLDIGLHITLIEERAILSVDEIRSLIKKEKLFYKNTLIFLCRYFLGFIDIRDIKAEMRAQIKKVLDSGLMITHVDSHRHLHFLPGIQKCLLSLIKEYKIPYIRCGYFHSRFIFSFGMLKRMLLNILLMFLKIKLIKNGIASCDRTIGLECSGHLTKLRLLSLLSSLTDGVTELICHPGFGGNALDKRYKCWGYDFENELRALLSSEARESIRKKGIILTSFFHLNNTLTYGY